MKKQQEKVKNDPVLNPNPYMMGFIKFHGEAKKVQHLVELGYQALIQLQDGRRFGSSPTFAKFAKAFADFNISAAAAGREFVPPNTPASKALALPDMEEVDFQSTDFAYWKSLFIQERRDKNEVRKLADRLTIDMLERNGLLTDQEGSKLESSSQTTAWAEVARQITERESYEVYGLIRYNKTNGNSTPVIPLNPFTPVVRQMPVRKQG